MGDVAGGLSLDLRAPARAPAPGLVLGPEVSHDHEPASEPPVSPASRLHFWRSPPGQPAWARPALLLVAAVAALSYGCGLDHSVLETFYAGAARSMSGSWHNFFFG